MAPPGNKRIHSSPHLGRDIVSKMFEGGEKKKLDDAQQATQLREQTKSQASTARAADQAQAQESAEEKTRGEEPQEGRKATRENKASSQIREEHSHETTMDAFLKRSSQQQQNRQAGREMTRTPTMSSLTAQGWSVANSPQTPETARNFILAQQTAQQNPPSTGRPTQPNSSQQASQNSSLPHTSSESHQSLTIHYANLNSSGGGEKAPAYSQRGVGSEFTPRALEQMVQSRIAALAQQVLPTGINIAVQIKPPLVFVRDGKDIRSFQIHEDGSLRELPSEEGHAHPLSPEARALLQKVMRQHGSSSNSEGYGASSNAEAAEITPEQLAEIQQGQSKPGSSATGESIDFETRFALLLHQVLEERKAIGKEWKEGELSFPEKEDWAAFFANLLKVGNQEKEMKKALDEILGMIFRGVFNKKGKGNTLVGDFKFLQNEKSREEKFAQIAVEDPALFEQLAQLKPGQEIGLALLRQWFGDELTYLKMKHLAQSTLQLVQGAEKDVTFDPKARIDPYSQARLERSIFGDKKSKVLLSKTTAEENSDSPQPNLENPGFLARIWEWTPRGERYPGRPRFFTFVAYIGLTIAFLGAIVWLISKFL